MADNDSRAGRRYADAEVLSWADDVHARHDDALKLAFEAPNRADMPAIQVGRSEGKLLELLTRLIRAERVVEVGTLAGYSAIRMARGMAGGKVWSIEFDQRHADVAREQIAAAGLDHSIEVLVGAGVDVLPTLDKHGPFDLVFIDADKESYAHYGKWARDNLRRGGLLVGDNAYLFGKLLEDTPRGQAMRSFHEDAAEYFDSVCLPTPDGMIVGMRR